MARPTITEIDVTKTGWVATLNSNTALILDTPFPIFLPANKAALDAIAPALYVGCFAIVATDSRVYFSDGSTWELYDAKLDFVADMNPGVSTIADIKNAYANPYKISSIGNFNTIVTINKHSLK